MLQNLTKTVGSAIATLCLVSTLAVAQAQQPPSQSQSPSPPVTPQMGNTTPQQGHRQTSQGEMQNPSQGQMMRLVCTRDNGKGVCTAATGPDGKEIVVNGDGVKSGGYMNCVDRGTVVDCEPAS